MAYQCPCQIWSSWQMAYQFPCQIWSSWQMAYQFLCQIWSSWQWPISFLVRYGAPGKWPISFLVRYGAPSNGLSISLSDMELLAMAYQFPCQIWSSWQMAYQFPCQIWSSWQWPISFLVRYGAPDNGLSVSESWIQISCRNGYFASLGIIYLQ